MATKAKNKKSTKRISKVQEINNSFVNASKAAINTTVENGEKWQKLTKKLVKKSEPVRKKQMNMVFETAKAVKDQVASGTERAMDLVGVDSSIINRAKEYATKHPVSKKVVNVAEDLKEKVADNPMVKKVEKTTEGIKQMGIAKFQDVKEDVLEQAQKILQRGEDLVEDAKTPKKTSKKIKDQGAAKVKAVRKTVAKKASITRKTTEAKVEAVQKAAKTVVKEIKTKGTAKVAEVKFEGKEKVAEVKKATKKAVKTTGKDDLKLIYGVGPKVEFTFNKHGINTYGDLVKAEKSKIVEILEEAGPMFKNVDTADWKKQAEVGVEGGEEAVREWVARYRTA